MPVEVWKSKSGGKIIVFGGGVLRKNSNGKWGFQKEENGVAILAEPSDLIAFLNQEEERYESAKENGEGSGE